MQITNDSIKIIENSLNIKKVLVVGDVMLDRYCFGEVSRISPEAPVPIVHINKIEDRPGGAANVARNIASLGGNVTLLSAVGKDEASESLEKILSKDNVNFHLMRDTKIKTTIKQRILARNQQLMRLDFEEVPSHEILFTILDKYTNIIKEFDVIIFSDYGKGGLSHIQTMIELANSYKKLILIDPKGHDYSKYTNATIITPNKQELKDVTGNWTNENELQEHALKLKTQLNLKYLLLTRSEEGMTLFNSNNITNYATIAKEVFDVSGAGDTVIATLGLMLANELNIDQAVQIANIAAGIVVGKIGTATVSKIELLNYLKKNIIKNI